MSSRLRFNGQTHNLPSKNIASVLFGQGSPHSFVATKAMVTLGPSVGSVKVLCELLNNGMSAAVVDLSYTNLSQQLTWIRNLKVAAKMCNKIVALLIEIHGQQIVITQTMRGQESPFGLDDPISFCAGDTVVLAPPSGHIPADASDTVLLTDQTELYKLCKPGDRLWVYQYGRATQVESLQLTVTRVVDSVVYCSVVKDITVHGHLKAMPAPDHTEALNEAVPHCAFNLPVFHESDYIALHQISEICDVDFVILSCCHSAQDAVTAHQQLAAHGLSDTKLIARLDSLRGLHNFDEITAQVDGVYFCRGHLGLHVAPWKMAPLQKQVISRCNLLGVPVMLNRVMDSMACNPRPTRAEATDVANAVLEGVDGVVLRAEVQSGKFPVDVLTCLLKICREAEAVFDHEHYHEFLMSAAFEEQQLVDHFIAALPADTHAEAAYMRHLIRNDSDAALWQADDEEDSSSDAANVQPGMRHRTSDSSLDSLSESIPTSFAPPPTMLRPHKSHPAMDELTEETQLTAEIVAKTLLNIRRRSSQGNSPMLGRSPAGSFKNLTALALPRTSSWGSMPLAIYSQKLDKAMPHHQAPKVYTGRAVMAHAEALASSAVRVVGKTDAALIIVFANTGRMASLIAKYKPVKPVMVVVLPSIASSGVHWHVAGASVARQACMLRGCIPLMLAPQSEDDDVVQRVLDKAEQLGHLNRGDRVVALLEKNHEVTLQVLVAAAVPEVIGSVAQMSAATNYQIACD